MKRALMTLITAAALGASVTLAPNGAEAENGQIAAGVLGGLAVGTILGATAAPRPYYAPEPMYAPAPVYAAPPAYAECYWTRGAPVWDNWRGIWVRPRVQVCD
jgi:hypothetical protein